MDDDKLKITLRQLGISLPPLTIKREDEIYYRQAEKAIPRILANYKEAYTELTDEQHLYMTLVHFAANMFCQLDNNETEPLVAQVKEAVRLIEEKLDVKAAS